MPAEQKATDWKDMAMPHECAATGQSCRLGPHGPGGSIQCEFCGAPPPQQTTDGATDIVDVLLGYADDYEAYLERTGDDSFLGDDDPGLLRAASDEIDRLRKLPEQVLRAYCDEHGPSGGAWNISGLLDAMREAK